MRALFSQERMILGAAIMLLALSACSGMARASDIFVDQANRKADDKNAGTLKAPLKTIQAAMDKAKAGDAVRSAAASITRPSQSSAAVPISSRLLGILGRSRPGLHYAGSLQG